MLVIQRRPGIQVEAWLKLDVNSPDGSQRGHLFALYNCQSRELPAWLSCTWRPFDFTWRLRISQSWKREDVLETCVVTYKYKLRYQKSNT